jgi:hypothetical protein
MPLTVCFAFAPPSLDVTDHIPPSSDWLPRPDTAAEVEFVNTPDLFCHAANQSSWHSFIACAPHAADISAIADIANFASFIIISFFSRGRVRAR